MSIDRFETAAMDLTLLSNTRLLMSKVITSAVMLSSGYSPWDELLWDGRFELRSRLKIRRDLQLLNLLLWKIPREIAGSVGDSLYNDPAEKGSCYLKVLDLYAADQWPRSHLDLVSCASGVSAVVRPKLYWQSILALISLHEDIQSPGTYIYH